eukprot:TRINITY_DN4334_c0_g1_i1.p1 TRINITY_DN4334_c0_g1~~TRINITY_DN4334_c0_g1_i1.p1  ORF type:complete len:137 (-),score=27.62 TRINITY_DN4334_c0_g1_i1:222-632(-)
MDTAREQYIAYLVEKAEAFEDSPEKREALSNLLPPSQLASKGLAPTPTPAAAASTTASAPVPSTPPRTTTTVISSTGKSARGGGGGSAAGDTSIPRSPLRTDDGLATATSTYATPGQHPRSSSNGDVFSGMCFLYR